MLRIFFIEDNDMKLSLPKGTFYVTQFEFAEDVSIHLKESCKKYITLTAESLTQVDPIPQFFNF